MPSPPVQFISRCMVKPKTSTPPRPVHHLTPWDLAMLSTHYIQKGLLFSTSVTVDHIIDNLKSSLSATLDHFYPLAGRLVTNHHPNGISISVECTNQGVEFIHSIANNLTVANVVNPDVPSLVRSFFPLTNAVSHDGHSLPLVSVQLTELADGFFLACCFNHALGDGTSYWHFFSTWAEITRNVGHNIDAISRQPVLDGFIGIEDDHVPPITLPFSEPDECPLLREKIFHFSSKAVASLKKKANNEEGGKLEISSFQALSAHVWRSITRARGLPPSSNTICRLAAQNRARIKPPLSNDYFGNSLYAISATTTVRELLDNGLCLGASALNRAVREHDDSAIRKALRAWYKMPVVYPLSMCDGHSVMIGGSPRFDMYGCDFGWGKAVAARSGGANKFDGKVSAYPGREGEGSVDLEVCLLPENMRALEMDDEFMSVVSSL